MANFQQKVINAGTSPGRFFTTATVITWGVIYPHASNTGNVLVGTVSGSEGIKIATSTTEPLTLPKYSDVSTLFVNGGSASNQAILLYILQD